MRLDSIRFFDGTAFLRKAGYPDLRLEAEEEVLLTTTNSPFLQQLVHYNGIVISISMIEVMPSSSVSMRISYHPP
jgi:hypothetical protein